MLFRTIDVFSFFKYNIPMNNNIIDLYIKVTEVLLYYKSLGLPEGRYKLQGPELTKLKESY